MTTRRQIELDSFVFLAFAAAVGITFAIITTNHVPKIQSPLSLPVMQIAQITPTQTEAPTPTPAKPTTVFQTSPDGTKTLYMTVTPGVKTTSYLFVVSSDNDITRQTVYSITLPNSQSMSIPFNTFSPNDTYFFVQQNTATGNSSLVLRTDGTTLTNNASYVNVTNIFKSKEPSALYDTTTGWASDTLLIILTKNPDKTEGTSYWFELPDEAVIPLATEF